MMEMLQQRKFLQFILLIAVFLLLCMLIAPSDGNWLWRLPPLLKQMPVVINNSVDFLMFEWLPIEVYDPEIEEYLSLIHI